MYRNFHPKPYEIKVDSAGGYFSCYVGQTFKVRGEDIKIQEIYFDENEKLMSGNSVYCVIVSDPSGEEYEWKRFENQSVSITNYLK